MSAISRYVLLVLFVLVNLVAFALMGVDKQRARTSGECRKRHCFWRHCCSAVPAARSACSSFTTRPSTGISAFSFPCWQSSSWASLVI